MSSQESHFTGTAFTLFDFNSTASSSSTTAVSATSVQTVLVQGKVAAAIAAEKDALAHLDALSDQILAHYSADAPELSKTTAFAFPELPAKLAEPATADPVAMLAADYARVCAANAELVATTRGLQQMNAELAIYAQRLLAQLAKFTPTAPAPPLPLLKAAAAGTAAFASASTANAVNAAVRAPGGKRTTAATATQALEDDALPFIPAAFVPLLRAAPGGAFDDACGVCCEIRALTAVPLPAGPICPPTSAASASASTATAHATTTAALLDDTLLARAVLPGSFGAAGGAAAAGDGGDGATDPADPAAAPAVVAAAAARAARAWAAAEAAHTDSVRAHDRAASSDSTTAATGESAATGTGAEAAGDGEDEDGEAAQSGGKKSGWGATSMRVALWAVLMSAVAADVLLRERALKLEYFHT